MCPSALLQCWRFTPRTLNWFGYSVAWLVHSVTSCFLVFWAVVQRLQNHGLVCFLPHPRHCVHPSHLLVSLFYLISSTCSAGEFLWHNFFKTWLFKALWIYYYCYKALWILTCKIYFLPVTLCQANRSRQSFCLLLHRCFDLSCCL